MSKPFTITFAGDTSLGDWYLQKPNRITEKERLERDPFSFAEETAPIFKTSNFSILNLETVLEEDPDGFQEGKQYPNWDHPERTVNLLKDLNIKAVSLANNHTMDFGPDVLLNTISTLKSAGIQHFGAGSSLSEAVRPLKIEVKAGLKKNNVFVFTGMRASRRYREDYGFMAKKDSPGVNSLNENRMLRKIEETRAAHPEACIVICPHWQGSDYKWVKPAYEVKCRKFIDAGADFVFAHGTHMANHIEKYENGVIAYSIGNYIFNSPGRYDKMNAPPFSLIVELTADYDKQSGWSFTPVFYPIVTDNRRTGFKTRFADRGEAAELLHTLNEKQYIGDDEEVICDKDHGPAYVLPKGLKNIKLTSDEVAQLLPDPALNTDKDLSENETFKDEVKQLEDIQVKIETYLKDYYQTFAQNKSVIEDKDKLETLSAILEKRFISHGFLKKFERKKIPMLNSFSFKDIMVEQSALRKLGHQNHAWQLDRKTKAFRFADEIGLRRPKSSSRIYTFDEIKDKEAPIVIKPVQSTGSRGVYLIFNDSKILSARNNKYLSSREEMIEEMREPLAAVYRGNPTGQLLKDEWITEELILREEGSTAPPLDYKFYCFYGELLFVLEADRSDASGFSVWNADGTLAVTGWQDEKLREGIGFSQEDADEALRASLEIPAPFIRMDMLKSPDGIVFGEATPRPGKFHLFNKKYDQLLGRAYKEAEARLQRDMLNGKEFAAFKKHFTIK
ncbi:CapA family protein [Alkalicoccus luteus]|uniref:Capsule synthesis protein CapA domain-containing protein n=1 Tax=Alkalicoccus luteus TaxID=1237094 RepID=A0A969PNG4_9BACI|nr:CapA family protein [Alkalicoccus luteus]NJP37421.1 hypothetical protein [Alkalicoccus luteus]